MLRILSTAFGLLLLLPLQTGAQTSQGRVRPGSSRPLPTVADGFVVEVVAECPELLWPSAVGCLADGSLLVGEDLMDMPGPANVALDRIWKYAFSGDRWTRTLFAQDLNAVFGIQEIDGKVFVMNMPHLTVLEDRDGDGRAEHRIELITDMGVEPPGAAGGFNDHIVSGIRLGMDGFIYVSVGDKGVPRATGTDGRQVTLRGGGVLRVRPDGTELEVVATGTRNHLAANLDVHDNVFTYDNTDDGLGWWTRVTHIVPGGHYGYPWDYKVPERQGRMLPAMGDFGGGSPVGGTVYGGDAWPAAFRNNLFWCEWGKQTVRRFRFDAKGSTFAIGSARDFMKKGKARVFRPLDACVSPCGRYLYVADWEFGGWKRDLPCGRLLRIRRTDNRRGAPHVRGRTPGALLSGIAHPAHLERLRAQRALADLGAEAVPALSRALASDPLERVRRHAVWALASIGGPNALSAIRRALTDRAPGIRAQAARALGQKRWAPDALTHALRDRDPTVVRESANALGRLPHPSPEAVGALVMALGHDDRFVRFTARDALRRLGSWRFLADLDAFSPRVQDEVFLALVDTFDVAAVEALAKIVDGREAPGPVRARCVTALAALHRRPRPWDGSWWSIQPAKTPPPAQVLPWEGTCVVLATVRRALDDPAPSVRRAATAALRTTRDSGAGPRVQARIARERDLDTRLELLSLLGHVRDPSATPLLRRLITEESTPVRERAAALDAALEIGSPDMLEALIDLARDARTPPSLLAPVLTALGRARPASDEATTSLRSTIVGNLSRFGPQIRATAVDALAALDRKGSPAAQAVVSALARERDATVREAAVRALGQWRVRAAVPALVRLADTKEHRRSATEALAHIRDGRALDAYLRGLAGTEPFVRKASLAALDAMRDELRAGIEARARQGTIPAHILPELQWLYSSLRPLREWRLLEPVGVEDVLARRRSPLDASRPHQDGYRETHRWRNVETDAPHGHVDLQRQLADRQQVATFGHAVFSSPVAREAELTVGSDDGITVWINGELVHDNPVHRGWQPDQDRLRVPLRAGKNDIQVRVFNGGGPWGFNLKIAELGRGPLFAPGVRRRLTVADYRRFATSHAGDARRGRALFRDPGAVLCSKCHVVDGFGRQAGPDLSDVGAKYDRAELITSVLEPSRRVLEGYEQRGFETEDGDVIYGLLEKEEPTRLTIVDDRGKVHVIRSARLASRWKLKTSAMPRGLHEGLTPAQFADLVAYLESLRGKPTDSDR